jgi:ABC-type enterochelin transport system ATPase subunit
MKKALLLFALVAISVVSINAQDNLKWGVMAGMNVSKYTITGFDRIILFKEGRIVGQGTFEELLHTDSYFMDLYNANVK